MRFVLIVLGIWGGMHLYAWLRVRLYAGLGAGWASALGILLVVLMASPIAGMALARAGHLLTGGVVSTVGMLWAGVFFLFFWVSAAHDAYNGLVSVVGAFAPAVRAWRLAGPRAVAGDVLVVALVSAYALFEAWQVGTRHVEIRTAKLPVALPRVRIVQVSDIHLGPLVGERRLSRILSEVRAAKPDLFICTGDLVDAERGNMTNLTEMLAAIEAPLGKYAVTGNHEYYAGIDGALAFIRKAGFVVLAEEAVRICPGFSLVGVDDETAHSALGGGKQWNEARILGQAPTGDVVVLLKHRPLVQKESLPFMHLQLSGHTHGGQVFPFTLFVRAYYEYGPGLHEPTPGTYLYTSLGAGTWGPPMRLLAPPEVTVVDFLRSAG